MLPKEHHKLIFSLCLISVLGLLSLTVWKLWGANLNSVNAAAPDSTTYAPLRGYAWASTIGWINMWNADKNYGVAIENCSADTCNFAPSSWAWSDNVGWIAFSDYTGSPIPSCGVDYWARFNKINRELSGCAYVLSMGSEGWINLNQSTAAYIYAISSGQGLPENWGVYTDLQRGKLSGYAWSGCKFSDNTEKGCGLGWINFKGTGYVVHGRPDPVTPSTELVKGDESHKIKISWSQAFGANYYQVYRKKRKCVGGSKAGSPCVLKKDCITDCVSDGEDPPSWTCQGSSISCSSGDSTPCVGSCDEVATDDFGLVSSKTGFTAYSFTDSNDGKGLDVGYNYTYAVSSCNILACVSSPSFSRRASPLEMISFNLKTVCSDKDTPSESKIYLSWEAYTADISIPVIGYYYQRCESDINGDCVKPWGNEISTGSTTKTDTLTGSDRTLYFKYRVRAYSDKRVCLLSGNDCTANDNICSTTGDICDFWTSSWLESAPVKACADASGYQEVRVE